MASALSQPAAAVNKADLETHLKTFDEATSVVVVEVPVQVVDREGAPVRGLTAENFEIIDDGEPRPLVSFDVLDYAGAGAEEKSEGPRSLTLPALRRRYLLLFDLSFSEPSSVLRARDAAHELLDRLEPGDLVAVGTNSLLHGPELILTFTPDRRQAALAVDSLGAPQLIDRSPDPLGLLIKTAESQQPRPEGEVEDQQRQAQRLAGKSQTLLETYLRSFEPASKAFDRRSQEIRLQGLTESLGDLASLMRSVDGRKYVVYFSEGFDSKLLLGEGGGDLETNLDIARGQYWRVDNDERFGSSGLQNSLEAMLESFRRADCAIHAVDIGGLRAPGAGRAAANGQEGLFAMAQGTGGALYRNTNDLGSTMENLLDRTGLTYVLAFQPENLEPNGEYHKLKVRLRNAPRGSRLEHRSGYYAPRPPGQMTPEERRLEAASQLLAGRPKGALDLALLATPLRAGDGGAAVSVLVEVGGQGLIAGSEGQRAAAQLYVYALGDDGTVAGYFQNEIRLDLAQVGERLAAGGLKFYGQLELPPGQFEVRALVRNLGSGDSGVGTTSVSVPDFANEQLVVLPPLVPESFERWLLVSQPASGQVTPTYPFVLNPGESFLPSAEPVAPSGGNVAVGLFAYGLGEDDPALDAQLLDSEGFVVLGQQLAVSNRLPGDDELPERLFTSVPLSEVPQGDYTLVVGVTDAASGRRDLVSIPLQVRGQVEARERVAAAQEPRRKRRSAKLLAAIEGDYRGVLTLLGSGSAEGAAEMLTRMEVEEGKRTDDVLLQDLYDSEMAVARELARREPDALIPVVMLHEEVYERHLRVQHRLLARHSRSMVRDLAELYVESGGSPTSLAAQAFTSLGGTLQRHGLTASANALFERALDLAPSNEAALLSLAAYHEKIGAYESAVGYLQRLVEAHPGSSEGWLRLGINLGRLEQAEDSRRWLERCAGDEAPPWIRSLAFQELARMELDGRRLQAAEATLRRGLEALPGEQRLLLQLAHVLDREGHRGAARAVLEEMQPDPPGAGESPRYHYNRWPANVIEAGRSQLADSASKRLPMLARAVSGMSAGGGR